MTPPVKCYWEDIEPGRVLETGTISLAAPEIRAFASNFDPQPYHLDRDLAEASLFGGLCASGWHVCALMMKLVSDRLAKDQIALLESNQVPWLKWHSPVFEGDTISGKITFNEKVAPEGKADFGVIGSDIIVTDQNDKKVMTLNINLMIESGEHKDG